MNGSKNWFASATVWGGLVAIGAALLGAFGYSLGADDQAQITAWVAALGGMIGGVVAIVGRVRASKRIG